MIVYKVDYYDLFSHTEEGEDTSQWFTSLDAAKKCYNNAKRELMQWYEDDHEQTPTERQEIGEVELEKITLADLPAGKLALAILNRHGYISKRETVLKEAVFWRPR